VASQLLETKLFAPRPRRGLVSRDRLIERLNRGVESRLTLISAPAGFGKSTLLAEWRDAAPEHAASTAWLALDAGDSDPAVYWANVIKALQTVAPGLDTSGNAPGEPAAIEALLRSLLNQLATMPGDLVLVLDDYHTIEGTTVHDGMAFLLEHLPAQVHVVLATRADPPLPLARIRAHGELVEIRVADLRFTADEAAAFLNDVMGLDLTANDVAALEGRTEGWAAALHLAALSMQGRDDAAAFIAGFAGDDRYVVDYLVEEVLERQPEDVRSFLLDTSILSGMSAPLCDAVIGLESGRATLEALDRANLFLVPLDDRRRWYRYHHLFGDVLRARLLDERPDRVPELHRRASDWYEQNGERAEAIRHALAGEDFERAAELIELAIPITRRARQDATRRQWLEALPDEVIRARPVLSNAYAGSLLVRGETEGVEGRLEDAERWLQPSAGRPDVVDEEAFRDLPGWIAVHRAGLARLQGDLEGTMRHASRARELIHDDDHVGRGAAAALLGLASWSSADLDAAYRGYSDAIASFERAGYMADIVGCVLVLADIRIGQGRLAQALGLYERGLQIATGDAHGVLRGAADMHVGLAVVLTERNDLDRASHHLRESAELGEENGLPRNPYRSRMAFARIRLAEGHLESALALLAEAERLYFGDFAPNVRPVPAVIARVRIGAGRLSEAWGWAHERGLSDSDDLSYLAEYDHATLARLLLAQGVRDHSAARIREARELSERLLAAASEGGRWGSVIDIGIVHALALHAAGDTPAALATVERTLLMAEPEGYVRTFVDEGAPMAALLKVAASKQVAPDLARGLLEAFGTGPGAVAQPLVEPLSERELEVLRLLAGDLDGPDIARELVVSLNTVRTHTKNIYAKLGVNSRRAAVRRAAELELLSRSADHRPTS
jgi:LuxR family maltose regulon positive regulatory protein